MNVERGNLDSGVFEGPRRKLVSDSLLVSNIAEETVQTLGLSPVSATTEASAPMCNQRAEEGDTAAVSETGNAVLVLKNGTAPNLILTARCDATRPLKERTKPAGYGVCL